MLFKLLTFSKRNLAENVLLALFILPTLALTSISCQKDKDYSRKEYILVSDSLDAVVRQTQARILLPIEGSTKNQPKILYVWANTDYEISFQTDDEDHEDWIKVVEKRHNAKLGVDEILIEVEPMDDSYLQRTGILSLKRSDIFLNNFVNLVQGYPSRIGTKFDWLEYGSNNPLKGLPGKLIADWTDEEKASGWSSTEFPGNDVAYCYGRDGFVQLGDAKGHAADLITPYEIYLNRDTLLMAAFNAVAYKSAVEEDAAQLTIEVTGGGEFVDGTKSKTVNVKHMDPDAEDIPISMWNGTYNGYYIISTKDNPITSDTHVRLVADKVEGNNRIFIDNFNILTIKREWWNMLSDVLPKDFLGNKTE